MTRFFKIFARLSASAAALVLAVCAGCQSAGTLPPVDGELMVVNFQPQQTLRYRFVSDRKITIELLDPSQNRQDAKTITEKLDMVLAVTPLEVDPFGLSTIQFTCQSVDVQRSSFSGRPTEPDAMEALEGKTYQLVISPTGQIENRQDYQALLEEIGKTAFVQSARPGMRIKNPDMIFDWIYFNLYLWDAPTSIPNPLQGVSAGDQWQSRQLLPWPIPIPNMPTRDVTYQLDRVETQNEQEIAVLKSDYTLSPETERDFPRPYEGSFQIKGSLFSVMHTYRFQSIEGTGTQRFNLDTGTLLSDQQQYTIKATANFIIPLGQSLPQLTIEQTFNTELLGESQ